MHLPFSRQLNLTERQALQLQREMEETSWLYSDLFWKRALAIYGYSLAGHVLIVGPILFVLAVLSL